VWDREIAKKVTLRLRISTDQLALRWADELVNEIIAGRFVTNKQKWLVDFNVANPNKTSIVCSKEANKLVCSHGKDHHR
jgi:hypothetical protein